MDKQKQIEEMYGAFLDYKFKTSPEKFSYREMCENFINLGYTKIDYKNIENIDLMIFNGKRFVQIPEDAVVLTREEYTNYLVEYIGIKEIAERVRKETAEKFAERLKAQYPPRTDERCTLDDCYMLDKIDEICKEFTEGKNAKNE